MIVQNRELTSKAIILGLLLALMFGTANAYLGMKAGQTIAATIPAAVIAMTLFRIRGMRGGTLEQNIVYTAASVGGALVSGAIFVVPAFLMVEINGAPVWADLRSHYWQASMILVTGGILGVLFTVFIRRPLFSDRALPWPESVATIEIVQAGAEKSGAARLIFSAMAFGGLVQFLTNEKGLQVFRETISGFFSFPRSVVQHVNLDRQPIGGIAYAGGISWTTPSLSPALIATGYIIGPRLASVSFAGGVLAWWILIPLLLFFDPDLPRRIGNPSPEVTAFTVWFTIVRPIAVGTMMVAALTTMFSLRSALIDSVRSAFSSRRAKTSTEIHERDIPARVALLGILGLLIPIVSIYYGFTHGLTAAVGSVTVMTLSAFFLSVIGGYLVGLVGGTNQPLSGLTLGALILGALLIVTIGQTGAAGVAAVIGIAASASIAISISGSLVQDLKAGQMLGGTPWKMEVVGLLSVVLLGPFLMLVIVTLHEANSATGGIGGRVLPAPQAGLVAQVASGIVGGQMPWGLIGIGIALGVVLILCGARAPMLIAVGMYLPFETSSAIFLGGMMRLLADRAVSGTNEGTKQFAASQGIFIASGLIAGEAVAGVLLAALFLAGMPSLTSTTTGANAFPWLSFVPFVATAYLLIRIPARLAQHRSTDSPRVS